MNMRLEPFQVSFAGSVRRWALESGSFAPWTSSPSDEVFRAAMIDPDIAPYVLLEAERLVAYGEIWSEPASDEIELARIIVDPGMRRRGIGSALVRELISLARGRSGGPIWVRVVPDNTAALACYAKLGFVRASPEDELRFNQEAQSSGMSWLRLTA